MIRFPPPKIRWTGFSRPKRRKILDLTASATSDAFDFSSSESEEDEEEESPPWIFSFIFSMSVSPGCSAAMVRIASPKPLFLSPDSSPKVWESRKVRGRMNAVFITRRCDQDRLIDQAQSRPKEKKIAIVQRKALPF
ncbi:hypothetical protein BHM03_00032557 [Ensete ventricosum]|nr:hypothetical protein BHM03_00032557 [Ensete ventricosum]